MTWVHILAAVVGVAIFCVGGLVAIIFVDIEDLKEDSTSKMYLGLVGLIADEADQAFKDRAIQWVTNKEWDT